MTLNLDVIVSDVSRLHLIQNYPSQLHFHPLG